MDMSNSPKLPQTRPPRPASAVSSMAGVAGLLGFGLWVAIAKYYGFDGSWSALVNVVACGLPMVIWSVLVDKVHRNPSTGIDWSSPKPVKTTIDITITKLTGLWATWGMIAAVYCIFRFYWRDNFLFAMETLGYISVGLFALSIPYVMWVDRYLIDPKDGSWHFGAFLIGQDEADRTEIAHHLRAWAVKGFFCAFMLSIVPGGFGEFMRTDWRLVVQDPVKLAGWLIGLMFVIDIAFATVGYALTMKPLDSHIRTANPYMGGWVAALLCYPPFVMMGQNAPLNYNYNTARWDYWLQGYDALLWLWAGVLILLTAIYAWATVVFGIRFSNLTHRGILTHGPYAWTRHPAYLAKNSFWFLETLPFLVTSHSITDAVRNTVIIGCVAGIYYWRAQTEEKHLGQDPAYQAYSQWMDQYGVITSRLNRLLGVASKSEVQENSKTLQATHQ
jgi:protein-S-isoprenylcysteine O-methyltransferase Ste14